MTPREKAEAVVVAGMPAGKGFGGVLVRQWNVDAVRPPGSIVFADQEGGAVRTFRALAPTRAASRYRSAAEAFRAGRETAAGLRRAGVHATFAPVLDLADGPLGSRQFAKPEYGVAFARGLGAAACPKHFPGLGSTPQVDGRRARLRRPSRAGLGAVPGRDPRRRAVRDGRPCDLPAARAAPGVVRAEDVRAAATARLPRRRDHGLDRRPRQPLRAVLGAARAPCGCRHGADDERSRCTQDRRRARAARTRRRARREARTDQPVPGLGGGTDTVTVASTVLPFAPTARAVSLCSPGCSASAFRPSV